MKIKNFFYKYSIVLFAVLSSYLIVSFPFQYSQDKMNNVSQPVRWLGAFLFFVICFLGIKYKEQIGKILEKQKAFLIILLLTIVFQIATICIFKIQPINDLLFLHDEAIRMLKSPQPQVSLLRFGHYFGHYPNNYGCLLFLYSYYKVLSFFGIATKYFVLAANILNMIIIDIGIICGSIILKYLKSVKMSNLWMLLFLLNPWTYFWIFYYYTHTISFGIMMILFMLFVLVWKERKNVKGILYSFLLGIFIYIGIKIRITNLIVCIAVAIAVILCWKKKKLNLKQGFLIVAMLCGVALTFAGYQYKTKDMFPKENAQEFPMTHWLMMASHGIGRYDSKDVQFTAQLPSQKEKKEKTIQKIKDNYKKLGVNGTLQLTGIKLRAVWLVGDDDFTKMSYVSSDYRYINEYLNGKNSGWILMYSYLTRMALWSFSLIAALNLIREKDKWEYTAMLCVLGGMVFHIFWEANPKYSICFMGMMTLMMLSGIETVCDDNIRKIRIFQKKNIPIYLICVMIILLLQPMHNYLMSDSKVLDKSYAINQSTRNRTLHLSVKKDDTIKQSFHSNIEFKEIMIKVGNILDRENTQICLKTGNDVVIKKVSLNEVRYNGGMITWDLKNDQKAGNYFIEIIFKNAQKNILLPVYNTANYDIYHNGCAYIKGIKNDNADLFFSVSD